MAPDPPPDWKRVSQLVADALEQPASERAAWLAARCGGDQRLHREVISLLTTDAQAGWFLERAAVESTGAANVVATRARESLGLIAGRRVGPYQIIRELGHGGLGAVYLGARADQAFEKQVAIKVVRAAASDRGVDAVDALELDRALTRLEALDPQQGRIVELRFFGGLTIQETADVMHLSSGTVKCDWAVARAWLYRELTGAQEAPPADGQV